MTPHDEPVPGTNRGLPDQPTHIFVGLTEIAGYYRNLASGFDSLGVRTSHVDLSGNPYGYQTRQVTAAPAWIERLSRVLAVVRGGQRKGVTPRKLAWAGLRELAKLPVALWAILNCDTFIFGFRSHFFAHWELPVLRMLGKRTVFIFNGSDARPPYLDGYFVPATGPIPAKALAARTRRMKRRLHRIERWADAVIAHPPAAQLLDKAYVPWLEIGVPYPAQTQVATPGSNEIGKRRLIAVHAPSHAAAKGSAVIRQAVASVRETGVDVELVELAGRTNTEVLEALRRCDFVIDQAYSDTPMAGLATEAASVGKPSVVGGYELDAIAAFTPAQKRPPSLTCSPEDLQRSLAAISTNHDLRQELGHRALAFVEEEWSPAAVAHRVLDVIAGRIRPRRPSPEELKVYRHGFGLSEQRCKDAIRSVVEAAGIDALGVNDPLVRMALLEFSALGVGRQVGA